jgi:hypothetical protein
MPSSPCSHMLLPIRTPGNHRPPAHRTSPTIGFSVHLHSPTRLSPLEPRRRCIKESRPPRARRALLTASCCCGKRGRTWRSGSSAASWCGREAEVPGAAEPPRPGAPAGGVGHDRGRTVFQIPSQGGRYFIYRPPLGSSKPSDPFLVVGINRGETP